MPTKAAVLTFETTGSEFDYFLAQKLGMTVGTLRSRMSNDEYVHWSVYYARIAQREELERLKGGGKS